MRDPKKTATKKKLGTKPAAVPSPTGKKAAAKVISAKPSPVSAAKAVEPPTGKAPSAKAATAPTLKPAPATKKVATKPALKEPAPVLVSKETEPAKRKVPLKKNPAASVVEAAAAPAIQKAPVKTASKKAAPAVSTKGVKPKPAPKKTLAPSLSKIAPAQPSPEPSLPEATKIMAKPEPQRIVEKVTVPLEAKPDEPENKPTQAKAVKPPAEPPFPVPSLPSFLFDDDQPAPVQQRGPGYRYALIPQTQALSANAEVPGLPESYGTGRMYLTARDPEWIHADWDLSTAQLKNANKASTNGHLWLRVKRLDGKAPGSVMEIALLPDSRHWFIHIGEDNCSCEASLGFPSKQNGWVELARSNQVTTPRRGATTDFKTLFITKEVAPERGIPPVVVEESARIIPFVEAQTGRIVEFPSPMQEAPTKERDHTTDAPAMSEGIAPQEFIARSQVGTKIDQLLEMWWQEAVAEGQASLAGLLAAPGWTPAQAEALASLLRIDEEQRVWLGSLEITRELVARQPAISPEAASSLRLAEQAAAIMAESSPVVALKPDQKERAFWFKVNAELVIYGSVASGGKVRIGSRDLNLKTDGTFSQRFILPDGTYSLPIEAESGDGVEKRFATMHFVRDSEYRGEVNPHPQEASLKPPKVENVESAL